MSTTSPDTGIVVDLPPGVKFQPSDDELIGLYLLPRVRGEADPLPGLIIEDDAAANTHPWKLFRRHGLPLSDDLAAFFYVRANNDGRPDRSCRGGGTWKAMRTKKGEDASSHALLVDGGKIKWSRRNLNLNMGSGSIGWVMHEYSITDHPSLKICSISFTGHGEKRKRVPDGYDDDDDLEPATQRPRVDSGSASAEDQESSTSMHASSGSTTTQELAEMTSWQLQEQQVLQTMEPLLPYAASQEPAQEAFSAVSQLPSSAASWTTTTTTLNQDDAAGPVHDHAVPYIPCAVEMDEIFNILDQVQQPDCGEVCQQQFDEEVVQTMEPQLPCASQEPVVLQLPSDPFQLSSVVEDMFLPTDDGAGEFCQQQQFDGEQVPARTMGQNADQDVVIPSFSGAQDTDSVITVTQDGVVEWGGYSFS